MRKHNPRSGTATSVASGIVYGLVAGMCMIVLSSAVMAILLDHELLQWKTLGYGIMATLIFTSFIGATISCNMIKRKRMQISLLYGCLLWITLMGITGLFFGGQYDGAGVTAGVIFAGSLCAGLLLPNSKKGRTGRKIERPR